MNQPTLLSASLLALALSGCGGASLADPREYPPRTEPASSATEPVSDVAPLAREGRLPSDVIPQHYDLALWLNPSSASYVGTVTIDLDVHTRTRFVVLHGRSLSIGGAQAFQGDREIEGSVTERTAEGSTSPDELVIALESPLEVGPARITVDFESQFDPGLRGLYRSELEGQFYVGSKFEPTDARRAFPCFDEPALRAPFHVTITAPSGMTVASNAPVHETLQVGEEQRVEFEETPAIPTYLVAFMVGPYVRVEGTPVVLPSGRTMPLGAFVPRGREASVSFALDAATHFLSAMTTELEHELPYAKMDLVAVPGYSSGATEHPGLITFRDTLLLLDEGAGTREMRTTATIVAHELAHLWFGDDVGIAWWDDLWIKEGLASFYETRLVDAWRPELGAGLAEESAIFEALAHDALPTARPVVRPVRSTPDAISAYDPGVYARAAGLLDMIENHIGIGPFRDAMRAYVRANAGHAVEQEAMFDALDGAPGRASLRPVLAPFFTQAGAPVLSAVCLRPCPTCERTLQLTMSHGVTDSEGWVVPLRIDYEGATSPIEIQMQSGTRDIPFEPANAPCPAWIQPNAGHAYVRVDVNASEALRALHQVIASRPAHERIAFLHSTVMALFGAGYPNADRVADFALLLRSFEHENEPVVLETIALLSRRVSRLASTPAQSRALASATSHVFASHLARAGFAPREGESTADAQLRVLAITGAALGPATLSRAQQRLVDARVTAHFAGTHLPVNVLRPLLLASARGQRTSARIEAITARLQSADASTNERSLLVAALGEAEDAAMLQRGLDVVLTEAVRPNEMLSALYEAAESPTRVPTLLAWIRTHWDALLQKLPARARVRAATMVQSACDEETIAAHEAFVNPRIQSMDGGAHAFEEALAGARSCRAARGGQ